MKISEWLRGLELAQYEPIFRENAIDLEILPELTETDLEKLGRENRGNTERTPGRLPRSASRAASDQIWGTKGCAPVRGFDHSGRGHPGFRHWSRCRNCIAIRSIEC